eukprot:scaffold795_cov375-Prasinococcus_capsulatus_cf.AAC.20
MGTAGQRVDGGPVDGAEPLPARGVRAAAVYCGGQAQQGARRDVPHRGRVLLHRAANEQDGTSRPSVEQRRAKHARAARVGVCSHARVWFRGGQGPRVPLVVVNPRWLESDFAGALSRMPYHLWHNMGAKFGEDAVAYQLTEEIVPQSSLGSFVGSLGLRQGCRTVLLKKYHHPWALFTAGLDGRYHFTEVRRAPPPPWRWGAECSEFALR